MSHKVRKFKIILIIILCVSQLIYLQIRVIYNKNHYKLAYADAIIVLGHSIDEKNSPSKWLELRLKAALDLYNKGFSKKIIVSGGKGPKDNIAVAISMKNWLIKHGIPENAILVEDMSKNTYQNFEYSHIIALKNNINSIIVVTNDFHITRSVYIATMFFNEVYAKPAITKLSIYKVFAYLKEPLSIIKYTCIHYFFKIFIY